MSSSPHIIKKASKHRHSHHGGAWKVAYADFVTAMMAFFLLLWLLNAVTQSQLQGISDYFAPISKHKTTSGGGGLLQGEVVANHGVFDSSESAELAPSSRHTNGAPELEASDAAEDNAAQSDEDRALSEEQTFAKAQKLVRNEFEQDPELKPLAASLKLETTPEGLRIHIVDQDGLPMFPRGQATMYSYTRKMIAIVTSAIARMPQLIEVSGHTDATPFTSSGSYGNWELSADRANAARRAMVDAGLSEGRIARVVGKAANDPLLPDNPSAAANRRLTITLLRGTSVR